MRTEITAKFENLLNDRLKKIDLLYIGEDSVRYDFFVAISEIEKLLPSDIVLEYPIIDNAYIKRNNAKSKRNEKPLIDLVIDKGEIKLSIEFGLFRQNSNANGTINKTTRTTKMINDMIRVGLDSYYTNREAYFICLADEKMLGHQLRSKLTGKFPSEYIITKKTIKSLQRLKANKFDIRFINAFIKLGRILKSSIIFDTELKTNESGKEVKVIIWKIEMY